MDIEKLIEQYRQAADKWEKRNPVTDTFDLRVQDALRDAATALSTLQAENEEMQKKLNEFSEFLCHMTGGMLSKTNYTAQAMISAAEDYQQRVCDNYCDLRADLARVTAERDAAVEAVKNMAEYIVYPSPRHHRGHSRQRIRPRPPAGTDAG